jgi:hypothetical protein
MVEDFWGIFNNIRPPSRLNAGSNYHLFKVGIEPMWEHAANQNGGKWTYRWLLYEYPLSVWHMPFYQLRMLTVVRRSGSIPKRDGKKLIDDMWLYTALAMIGENFEAGEELCGAVIRCAWLAFSLLAADGAGARCEIQLLLVALAPLRLSSSCFSLSAPRCFTPFPVI